MPRGQYDRTKKVTQAHAVHTPEPAPQVTGIGTGLEPSTETIISPRQEAEKVQRRRRNNGDLNPSVVMRLGLPPEVMDDNKDYSLRWVNDEGGRIQHLTQQDDYDVVEGVDSRVVGTTADGKPLVARLLRKPKEFAEEDRKAKVDLITARERKVLRSADPAAAWSNPDAAIPAGNSYALSDNAIKGFKP